jgi:hypothetical protein
MQFLFILGAFLLFLLIFWGMVKVHSINDEEEDDD